ncbi:MAG: argininosuccinate lyase, partial [Chitinophagaceae bacterium]
ILSEKKYQYLFSVEEVNKLVLSGMPFRDAYKKVGMDIEKGEFHPSGEVHHSHEGSIGNLCNDQIKLEMEKIYLEFGFERAEAAIQSLLE